MVKPIGGYYGGKATLRHQIARWFPNHANFVSPFCGFASVELFKPQSIREYLSDLNPGTIAALKLIQFSPTALIERLREMSWGKEQFMACSLALMYPEKQDYFTLGISALAYSAMANQRGGSVSGYSPQQAARAKKRNWSYLHGVSDRLQGVELRCCPWQEALKDPTPETFYYLDPPYLQGGEHYQYPMPPEAHRELLEQITGKFVGKVALSGYDSDLYQQYLKGWRRVEINAQDNKRRARVECLWMNYS